MEKKDKIQLGITVVLVAVLLVLLTRLGGKRQIQSPQAVGKAPSAAAPVGEKPNEQSFYASLEEHARNLEFERDPFSRQPVIPSGSPKELYLKGILWDEANPAAVINDQVVTVGGQIDGKRILDILRDKVILEEDGREIELILE